MTQADNSLRVNRLLSECSVTLPASLTVFAVAFGSLDSALAHRLRPLVWLLGVVLTVIGWVVLRSTATRAWVDRGGWIAVILVRLTVALPTLAGMALLFWRLAAALGLPKD